MDTFFIIVAIILLLFVLFLILRFFRATTRIVPQEQRLIIYRLGRFHRIAGPGPVQVFPRLDQVMRTLEVRDHPLEVAVPGIFAFGVPNELTFNLWFSFDLARAAGADKEKLASLAQLSDAERRRQVEVKVREAAINQVTELQDRMPLPDKAALMDRIAALAPGTVRYNTLLKGVKAELERTLPSVGAILNPAQPIAMTKRGLSEEIIEGIKRRRGREMDSEWLTNYVDELRRRFPDLGISRGMLAQMLASIEGVDIGKVQRLFMEQETGAEAEVEFEMDPEGERPNVVVKPRAERAGDVTKSAQPAPRLTPEDFSVLKRIPRSPRDQQMSA